MAKHSSFNTEYFKFEFIRQEYSFSLFDWPYKPISRNRRVTVVPEIGFDNDSLISALISDTVFSLSESETSFSVDERFGFSVSYESILNSSLQNFHDLRDFSLWMAQFIQNNYLS